MADELTHVAENLQRLRQPMLDVIATVDTALEDMSIGVEVVVTSTIAVNGRQAGVALGYLKFDGRWRVVACRAVDGHPYEPFAAAPIDVQAEAIGLLPRMLEVLTEKGRRLAMQLADAGARAREMAEGIRIAQQEIEAAKARAGEK